MTFAQATTEFQRHLLQRELLATQWNVSEVARRLDITRQHVYNLVKAYGLKREPLDDRLTLASSRTPPGWRDLRAHGHALA